MPTCGSARSPIRYCLSSALVTFVLVLSLTGAVWSQSQPAQSQPAPTPKSSTQPQATTPVPGAGVAVQNQPSQTGSGQSAEQPKPESRISKAQAKDLFRSVDEILQFVSQDTGLPIKHQVKRRLITREEVEKYVDKQMKDDKDKKRLEQSKLVLEKFGLLPPDYDLHSEFLRLMAEQVAAYYDPKTKSVNLLDWVQPDVQKPILAHELTHALQDQMVGVEKWELAGAKDDATPLPDQQEYVVEEEQAARQCVTEGQGMAAMFDYTLAPLGKDILTAPEYVDAVRAAMGDSKDSPVFDQAPMFLKESLLMPYTFGLDFVRSVMAKQGKDAAFAGILEKPPIDTRQVMQPQTYLMHVAVPPLKVPDLNQIIAPDYRRFDFGGMGEFDIYLLAKQYGADDTPNYYRHWRGGYYFAAHKKGAPKDQIAMLFFTHWDSPEAAYDFAKLYADYVPNRYPDGVKWTATCPDAAAAGSGRTMNCITMSAVTKEGPVLIQRHDDDLLILEGYDAEVMQKARKVLFSPAPPSAQAGTAKN